MKIQVIINQARKNAQLRHLEKHLTKHLGSNLMGLEITSDFNQVTDVARRMSNSSTDKIVVVGGDGTVNAALNGIVGTDVALGIIPIGLANDLASLYRIPSNLVNACDIILSGYIERIDLINVNGWFYVTAGGFGLGYEIADIVNKLRVCQRGRMLASILKGNFYLFVGLYLMLKNGAACKTFSIESDGESFVADTYSLTVANQSFLGKYFYMTPEAINDDGMFDVCLIKNPQSLMRILLGIGKVLTGSHVKSPYVKMWRAEELTIKSPTPMNFFADGELYQGFTELNIKIAYKSLNLIVAR